MTHNNLRMRRRKIKNKNNNNSNKIIIITHNNSKVMYGTRRLGEGVG